MPTDKERLDWLEQKGHDGELPNINVCGSILYVCFGTDGDEDVMGHADNLREALDAAMTSTPPDTGADKLSRVVAGPRLGERVHEMLVSEFAKVDE